MRFVPIVCIYRHHRCMQQYKTFLLESIDNDTFSNSDKYFNNFVNCYKIQLYRVISPIKKECRIYINKVLTIYLYIHILIYILLFLKINCNFLLFMSRKLYASGIKVYLRKKSVLILCERQYCKIYKKFQLGMMVCRLKCVHSGFLLKRRCPLTFFQKNGVWYYGRNQSILVMSIYRIPVKQNDLALYLKKINSDDLSSKLLSSF